MTDVDWLELMEEPPGGFNHGRERGTDAGWHTLETPGVDEPSLKHFPPERWSSERPIAHGTAGAYVKRKCRCDECRAWNAAHQRRKRSAVPTRNGDGDHR